MSISVKTLRVILLLMVCTTELSIILLDKMDWRYYMYNFFASELALLRLMYHMFILRHFIYPNTDISGNTLYSCKATPYMTKYGSLITGAVSSIIRQHMAYPTVIRDIYRFKRNTIVLPRLKILQQVSLIRHERFIKEMGTKRWNISYFYYKFRK
jgi:hypothetical protein